MTYTIYSGSNLDILPTLPDNSVDAIVTDPPYGLSDNKFVADTIAKWISGERHFIPDGKGFMGKSWDAFVPPPALWDECLRVLKPGGHLLAFFGSRTQDIGALSIRLAGFEIRDSIAWMYGSGFPKSLDISKAIDKSDAAEARRKRDLQFVEWMRTTGIKASQANAIVGKSDVASHYFRLDQPAVATAELFDKLRPYLPEVPDYIETMIVERTIESENFKNREVIGQKTAGMGSGKTFGMLQSEGDNLAAEKEIDITAPSTPEAKQWEGWGTALKPAFEPIVVARKPLIGTFAENVLTHGTGGLNIDGSRIAADDQDVLDAAVKRMTGNAIKGQLNMAGTKEIQPNSAQGRWPANVILDPYTAELLDEQSGTSKGSGTLKKSGTRTLRENPVYGKPNTTRNSPDDYGDSGGASRFFYVAKASKRDRNEGLEELEASYENRGNGFSDSISDTKQPRQNFHPTVKPTDLMRYLVKLVTPPNGTVLDPFTGSGSTGKAAILEGFDFIGIELTEEYLPIIEGRLKHAEAQRAEEEAKKDEALF